jgi:hypothetical protein
VEQLKGLKVNTTAEDARRLNQSLGLCEGGDCNKVSFLPH